MKFGCGITEIKNFEHQITVVQLIPLLAQKWVGLKEINFTSSFQGAYISMYRKSINGYFSVFQTDTNKIISRILPCIRTQLRNWTEQYARTVNLRKITFSRIKLSTKKSFFPERWARKICLTHHSAPVYFHSKIRLWRMKRSHTWAQKKLPCMPSLIQVGHRSFAGWPQPGLSQVCCHIPSTSAAIFYFVSKLAQVLGTSSVQRITSISPKLEALRILAVACLLINDII